MDVLWSWLFERFNDIHVMVASLFISGASIFLFLIFHSFIALLLITLIWAMANEAFRPASLSIISGLTLPEQRKTAFSINRLAINLGMSIGPAIGGFVSGKSFSALFIINGITTLLAGLLLCFKLLPKRFLLGKTGLKVQTPIKIIPKINIFLDKRLFYFLFACIPVTMVFVQHESTLSIFMVHDLHIKMFYYGFVFTINTLLIVFLEVPLSSLTSHWPDRKSLVIGSILITLGFGSLLCVNNFLGIAIAVALWTLGEIFLYPTASTYISKIAPSERQGSYMALHSASFNVSMILGPWVGMYLLETTGSAALWQTCVIGGIISTCMFLRIQKL